jgi:hypothetical protein
VLRLHLLDLCLYDLVGGLVGGLVNGLVGSLVGCLVGGLVGFLEQLVEPVLVLLLTVIVIIVRLLIFEALHFLSCGSDVDLVPVSEQGFLKGTSVKHLFNGVLFLLLFLL